MDTPKTEEKTTTVNAEGNKSEAPKKKKNIIRVFHAQNASDGGKGRRKPAAGEKKGPARSQNGGQRPAGGVPRRGCKGGKSLPELGSAAFFQNRRKGDLVKAPAVLQTKRCKGRSFCGAGERLLAGERPVVHRIP